MHRSSTVYKSYNSSKQICQWLLKEENRACTSSLEESFFMNYGPTFWLETQKQRLKS